MPDVTRNVPPPGIASRALTARFEQHLPDLAAIGQHDGWLIRSPMRSSMCDPETGAQLLDVAEQGVQVDHGQLGRLLAAEDEQLAGQPGTPAGDRLDLLRVGLDPRPGRARLGDEGGVVR